MRRWIRVLFNLFLPFSFLLQTGYGWVRGGLALSMRYRWREVLVGGMKDLS